MKKKNTSVAQPGKTETGNTAALHIDQNINPKMYRDHKVCDHYTHGRTNKFPFGGNHGPIYF